MNMSHLRTLDIHDWWRAEESFALINSCQKIVLPFEKILAQSLWTLLLSLPFNLAHHNTSLFPEPVIHSFTVF